MASLARRLLLLPAAVFIAFTLAGALSTPASAQIDGGCTGSVNGVAFGPLSATDSSDHITVQSDAFVPVTMSGSRSAITHYTISLEFLDHQWVVADRVTSSQDWADAVRVADYAKYGVGMYKVVAVSDLYGGVVCHATGFVFVEGNPVGTAAGMAALGLTGAGAVGVGMAGFMASSTDPQVVEMRRQWEKVEQEEAAERLHRYQELREVEEEARSCCFLLALPALLLTTAAMVAGGAPTMAAPAPAFTSPPAPWRVHWRPRLSAVGIASSLAGAVGVLVLLQQYGKVFPTLNVAIYALVAALLVGAGLPSLMRLLAVRRTNRVLLELQRLVAEDQARTQQLTWVPPQDPAPDESQEPRRPQPPDPGTSAWQPPGPAGPPPAVGAW